MFMEANLKELAPTHHLRNLPLIEVGAYYIPKDSKVWAEVRSAYNIAKKTFNQLADVWLIDEWKATKDPLWDDARIDIIGQNGNEGLHYEQTNTCDT